MAKKAATQRSKAKAAKETGDGSGEAADGQLFETEINVTPEVRKAADKYKAEKLKKSKQDARYKAAEADLIDEMEIAECPRVKVTLGKTDKWIVCDHEPKLHQEVVKENAPEAGA